MKSIINNSKILFCVIFFVGFIKINATDTLYTYPMNKFKMGPLYTSPITSISSFSVTKYLNKVEINRWSSGSIKPMLLEKSNLKLSRPLDKEGSWIAELVDSNDIIGDYFYLIEFRGINSRMGSNAAYKFTFQVYVREPIIIDQSLLLRNNLFFGEKIKFNIGALGLDELQHYSYQLLIDGHVYGEEKKGLEVDLEEVLSAFDESKKSLSIIAKYKGHEIEYDKIGKLSNKKFNLLQPQVDALFVLSSSEKVQISSNSPYAYTASIMLIGRDNDEFFNIPFELKRENIISENYMEYNNNGYFSEILLDINEKTNLKNVTLQIEHKLFNYTFPISTDSKIIKSK